MLWVFYMKLSGRELVVKCDKKKDLSKFSDYFIMALPMFCDLIGSTAQYYALLFVESSVY